MADDKKSGKIGGVRGTVGSTGVEKTGSVGEVDKAKKASAVKGVKGVRQSGAARATRTMSAAERQQLFRMIEEEADKLFGEGGLPQSQRKVVEDAVKMAVDAAILDDEQE
ncbi:MAG: hypothetical protein KDD42_09170 [Bdellovibrionales bacterium]|nr:hypothetical protein [Bdellovibrionales bacterium]